MTDRRGSDGRIKRNAADATVKTHGRENGRDESWQADPSNTNLSMLNFTSDAHKGTGRSRIAQHPLAAVASRNIRREIVILPPASIILARETAETTPYTYTYTPLSKSIIRNTEYYLSYCCVTVCCSGVAA